MKLPPLIIELAKREVGVTEINGTNCGPRVDQYKAATWLNPKKGWPWCAAFVCFIVREALLAARIKETKTFKRPRTAGAYDFENWCLDQDNSVMLKKPPRGDIQPGDIVIFRDFSHIGFAISSVDAKGNIRTVEGNTDAKGSREGGGVFEKVRPASGIRSRLRFTI